MKIVLTGATGFAGAEILRHLVANPVVDRVTCLTRRPVEATSPKVVSLLHEDFAQYDGALFESLADHAACIWALGAKASDVGDEEAYTRVTHGFTLAFARGMARTVNHRFTFCYLSGMGADPEEASRLPWQRLTRHLKGRTERDLARLREAHPYFHPHAFRPGGILPAGQRLLRFLLSPITVGVGELADAMVAGATEPALLCDLPIIDNDEIHELAEANATIA